MEHMFPSTTCMSSYEEFSFVCQCPGRTSMQKACCTVFYLTLCSLGESQNYKKTRSRTPNFCLSDLMPSIYQSILLTTAPSKNPAYHCTNKASCLPWQQQSILLTIAPSEYHHWSIPLAIALTNWNTHMYFGCQTYKFYYNDDSILCFCNMDLFY